MLEVLETINQNIQTFAGGDVDFLSPIENQRPPDDEQIRHVEDNLPVNDRGGADVLPLLGIKGVLNQNSSGRVGVDTLISAAQTAVENITGRASSVGFNGGIIPQTTILPMVQKPAQTLNTSYYWLLIIPILYYFFKKNKSCSKKLKIS